MTCSIEGGDGHLMKIGSEVFVVRLWSEPRAVVGARSLWRGSVEQVSVGDKRYFATMDQLLDCLRRGMLARGFSPDQKPDDPGTADSGSALKRTPEDP